MAKKKTLSIFNHIVRVYKNCSIRRDMDHHLALQRRTLRKRRLFVRHHTGSGGNMSLLIPYALSIWPHFMDVTEAHSPSHPLQLWIMEKQLWVDTASAALRDCFRGTASQCQDQHLTTPLFHVVFVNEPFSLSYLLLRIIKAEALSLSIIALSWLNFKCKESRYISRGKKRKKTGVVYDYQDSTK